MRRSQAPSALQQKAPIPSSSSLRSTLTSSTDQEGSLSSAVDKRRAYNALPSLEAVSPSTPFSTSTASASLSIGSSGPLSTKTLTDERHPKKATLRGSQSELSLFAETPRRPAITETIAEFAVTRSPASPVHHASPDVRVSSASTMVGKYLRLEKSAETNFNSNLGVVTEGRITGDFADSAHPKEDFDKSLHQNSSTATCANSISDGDVIAAERDEASAPKICSDVPAMDGLQPSPGTFECYLIMCKPAPEQATLYREVLNAGADPLETARRLRQVCDHPKLIHTTEISESQLEHSGKVCALSRIMLAMEDNETVAVLADAPDLLQAWKAQLCCTATPHIFALTDALCDPAVLGGNFQNIILFNNVKKADLAVLYQNFKEARQMCVYRLLLAGTIDERDFLDDLIGIDYMKDVSAARLRELSTRNELLATLKDRECRYRKVPEEEFAEVWPALLELGWHAEAGSGLVDYFYCRPNFTSKSGNSRKQKGKKHEDFFVSKEKALAYLKKCTPLALRVQFVHGLFDLAAWDRHPTLSSVPDARIQTIGDDCVDTVFSLHGML